MPEGNPKIVIWCGNAPNQKALAAKIAGRFPVAGIAVENRPAKRKSDLKTIINKVADRIFFSRISDAWFRLQRYYSERYADFPGQNILRISSINTQEVYDFTTAIKPDLVIVSGTSLIRKQLLSINPSIGIINLHTGLSPYVKGGPNCTNWCIANDEWHLVGNTIMWIDKGIDSGNILTTETVNLEGCKNLFDIHLKVMESAHDLYLRAIHYLLNTVPPFISIPQKDISSGKLYLTKMWNARSKQALLRNLKKFPSPGRSVSEIRTINLPAVQVKNAE
jgi:methionyl-tRNA formyltransferase